MNQATFVVLMGAGATFFLWRSFQHRRIDLLSLAFAATCVYFAPGLYGSVRAGFYSAALDPAAYAVMSIVVATLPVAAVAADRVTLGSPIDVDFGHLIAPVLLLAALSALAVSLFTIGPSYLCADKAEMLGHIDQWYYYAAYSVPLCFVAAYACRQWAIVAVCALLLAADLAIGFRASTAITFLGVTVLCGQSVLKGWRKAASFMLVVALAGGGLLMVKQAAYTIKYAIALDCERLDIESPGMPTGAPAAPAIKPIAAVPASAQVAHFGSQLGKSDIYLAAVTQSEPFVTQSILNETVRQNFQTGDEYLVAQLLSGVPGGATLFGLRLGEIPTFGSMFQPELFPGADFGMAGNPWAQAYAAGGLSMVLMFAIGYAASAAGLSLAFWKTSGPLRGCIAVLGAWMAFYFHRNDLLIQVGIMKHVSYTILVVFTISWALSLRRTPQLARFRVDSRWKSWWKTQS
jgi:hypothetical protein